MNCPSAFYGPSAPGALSAQRREREREAREALDRSPDRTDAEMRRFAEQMNVMARRGLVGALAVPPEVAARFAQLHVAEIEARNERSASAASAAFWSKWEREQRASVAPPAKPVTPAKRSISAFAASYRRRRG